MKTWVRYVLFVIFATAIVLLGFSLKYAQTGEAVKTSCGDDTFIDTCSLTKPYYCSGGELIEKASTCGCTDSTKKVGDECYSTYKSDPKELELKYVLNGEEKVIEFTAYKGVADYLSEVPQHLNYQNGQEFYRRDFRLAKMDNEIQSEFLMPLVIEIMNQGETKVDQARIAISLVQNLPYGESGEVISFRGYNLTYSRYPSEVLYEFEGICEEKVTLLAFLLREIGYGTTLLYYPLENHEAIGIKCPVENSISESGYCFVETTAPSLLSDSFSYYNGWGYLSQDPEISLISEGLALPENLEEFEDAKDYVKLNNKIKKQRRLNPIQSNTYNEIKEKYGL